VDWLAYNSGCSRHAAIQQASDAAALRAAIMFSATSAHNRLAKLRVALIVLGPDAPREVVLVAGPAAIDERNHPRDQSGVLAQLLADLFDFGLLLLVLPAPDDERDVCNQAVRRRLCQALLGALAADPSALPMAASGGGPPRADRTCVSYNIATDVAD
jgi:hypothetical protein